MLILLKEDAIKEENINIEKDNKNLDTNKSIENIDLTNLERVKDYIKARNIEFFENFELEELIGKGSESHVYKEKVKPHNRLISIKTIKREKYVKNEDEYKISKKLKNKNIIDTYGEYIIKEGELDCIMTEFTKYKNLKI